MLAAHKPNQPYPEEPLAQWFLRTYYVARIGGASTCAVLRFFRENSSQNPVIQKRFHTPDFHLRVTNPDIFGEYNLTFGFRTLSYAILAFTQQDVQAYFRDFGNGSAARGVGKEIVILSITTFSTCMIGWGLNKASSAWEYSNISPSTSLSNSINFVMMHDFSRILVEGSIIGLSTFIQNKILFNCIPSLRKPTKVYFLDPDISLKLRITKEIVNCIDAGRVAALSMIMLEGISELFAKEDLLKQSLLFRSMTLLGANELLTLWRNGMQLSESEPSTSRLSQRCTHAMRELIPRGITIGLVISAVAILTDEDNNTNAEFPAVTEFLIHWVAMSLFPVAVKGVGYIYNKISNSCMSMWHQLSGYQEIPDADYKIPQVIDPDFVIKKLDFNQTI